MQGFLSWVRMVMCVAIVSPKISCRISGVGERCVGFEDGISALRMTVYPDLDAGVGDGMREGARRTLLR